MIAEKLEKVKSNIKAAAALSSRNQEDIQLVAVSKTVSTDRIMQAYNTGQTVFGENYVQEFVQKQEKYPEMNWHFIGQLQSNKVKYIVNKISLLHSLDRISLAKEISKRYSAISSSLDVLVQVNIGLEKQKGGVLPENLIEFLDTISPMQGINLKGLMCIHPFDDPENCRKYFSQMKNIFENIKSQNYSMDYLSMGMSSDYVQAIQEGANIVRVGSAIFGTRNNS